MRERILEYLHEGGARNYNLKVLDNKYRKNYTGVTLNYIIYELLKAKYKKTDVAKCLLQLHKEGEIKSLFCPQAGNYVFMSRHIQYDNFDRETGGGRTSYTNNHNLHNYLNQFIKNE